MKNKKANREGKKVLWREKKACGCRDPKTRLDSGRKNQLPKFLKIF